VRDAICMWCVLLVSAEMLTTGLHTQPSATTPPLQPIPVQAPAEPLTLGPMTVATDLAYLSGQLVRITHARVYEVISPRLFTIEPAGVPSSELWWDYNLSGTVTPNSRGRACHGVPLVHRSSSKSLTNVASGERPRGVTNVRRRGRVSSPAGRAG
jgi:hypothetical protein